MEDKTAYEFLDVDKLVEETRETVVDINWAVKKAEEFSNYKNKALQEKVDKLSAIDSSIISELTDDNKFYVTLVSRLVEECVHEEIITSTQKSQIEKYMLDKID